VSNFIRNLLFRTSAATEIHCSNNPQNKKPQ